MSHKIFDNDLVTIRKSKATLTLNKRAYIRMFILDLSKVLIYEFYYAHIKKIDMVTSQDYCSQTQIVQ